MEKATYDEKVLLQQVAAGDEQAFAQLFDRYFHAVGEHMYRITRSRETAEEVMQDVFLKIWIAREALAEVRNFESFLFIASRNHALNVLKRVVREETKFHAFEENAKQQAKENEDPDLAEIKERYYSLLDEAVDRLPAQQQKVFIEVRRHRRKHEDIARELGVSKETVKKHLQLATKSISEYVRVNMDPMLVALLLAGAYEVSKMSHLA